MRGSFVAIILAAGYSSRMGAFKPLLPVGDTTALERVIALCRDAGIDDVRVVVGHRRDELLPLLEAQRVRSLSNARYQDGMFSSVVAGVESLEPECRAFFLLPVDIPLVRPATIELLAHTYHEQAAGILYPTFCGERGHPPLISSSYRASILSWQGAGGLNAFLKQYEDDSAGIETGDAGILRDMDTPEEYELIRGALNAERLPSRRACERLLRERFGADSPVARHSEVVARLALLMAGRLNERGHHLDSALVEAAALLHDIGKREPDHAAAGAAMLAARGYGEVAELVGGHMELSRRSDDAIDAADLVFLADKLVEGDEVVSLEVRFQRPLTRYADDSAAVEAVNMRLERANAVLHRVESGLGVAVAELWAEAQA